MASDLIIPPAGVSPACRFSSGSYGPLQDPPAYLADEIDAATGEFMSLTEGADPVAAAVQEQLRLRRGTGMAVVDQGNEYDRIAKVTDATPRQLEDETRRILQPFVERGDVRIQRLVATSPVDGAGLDSGLVELVFLNMLTGNSEQIPR